MFDLDQFAENAAEAHDAQATSAIKEETSNPGSARAVAQVSMTVDEKERYTAFAAENGQSLSAFLRLAANYYMKRFD